MSAHPLPGTTASVPAAADPVLPARAAVSRAHATRRVMLYALPLAALFLLFRLAFLPPTPDDLDSVNFTLGVRDFDVAAHRPHPPGYPIYIALGKLSYAALAAVEGATAPSPRLEARALGVWSAIFGALAVFPLLQFFRCVAQRDDVALGATALTVTSPLFLFTAGRPMSDVPGLTAAFAAIALLATAYRRQQKRSDPDAAAAPYAADADRARIAASGRLLVAGAFMAGLAIGVRSQIFWLTLPLLALVLLHRVGRGAAGALLGSLMTFSLGVLLWLLPLVAASGGPAAYLTVVRNQVTEDLTGVDLFVTNATPRRLAFGLLDTVVAPWALPALAGVVLGLAVIGFALMIWKARSGLVLLLAISVPYALFHLLFQENVTTRYALPLIPPVALLAAVALAAAGRRLAPVGVAALVAASLILTVPASMVYARTGSPSFRALADVQQTADAEHVLIMHNSFALATRGEAFGRLVLPVVAKREWLSLTKYWMEAGNRPVWFFAEPQRTDLAAVDPASHRLVRSYAWPFASDRFMKGIRPGALAWHEIQTPPGWFVGEGWSLTPELAGVVNPETGLPGGQPVSVFVRSRSDPAVLVIGGRHLGAKGEPAARLVLSIGDRVLDTWTATPDPGFFLRVVTLPAGTLMAGDPYSRLDVRSDAADGSGRKVNVALEQFDLQAQSAVVYGFDRGWYEQEYEPSTGRLWRWSSEQAHTRVHHGGRDLTVRIVGESPLRYFPIAPQITLRVGSQTILRASPSADFVLTARISAAALDAADGLLTLETSKIFVPADRSGSGDRRHLGLRIWSLQLTPEN